MKKRSPDQQLEYLFVNASRLVTKKYYKQFKKLGLNPSQITALVYLDRSGDMNQTELARHLSLGKAAVGTLLESLEKSALIDRRRDPQDQRSIIVSITAAGIERISGVDAIAEELGKVMRQGISREERRAFIETFNKLMTNLRSLP